MANLTDCKACGKPVSKTALLCPHCGQIAPSPPLRRVGRIAACILAGIIALVLLCMWIDKIWSDHQADAVRKARQDALDQMWRDDPNNPANK